MEDCCAVCAEPLEWVAYGPCGHREVCFTCTARMRFVMNDKHCCICKQECSFVFVTKALGDYTKVIPNFSTLPEQLEIKETGGNRIWYESNVEAYFDDEEPFQLIKAMCRLCCNICEQTSLAEVEDSPPKGTVKKGHMFKSIESLRRHHFTTHKLLMCGLCLEGRKVFICEQKLYTRTQLDRHASKGDTDVDGTEEERGGFAGHPMCAFCRKRFYGDNELYQHMSTEHYTCHLCQRSRPGHYEYYRNYDDLEMHFRNDHVLCEHSDCLAKKFVVFTSDAELKRHNATTHGGNMSRSQRNAALQIPVSFHFRRPGQDSGEDGGSGGTPYRRGGRGRGSVTTHSRGGGDSLDATVRASVEQAILEDAVRESAALFASTEPDVVSSGPGGHTPEGPNSFAALGESEAGEGEGGPSRYLSAVSGSGPSSLADSAFPPLPGLSKNARRKAKMRNQGPNASMAALLGGGGGRGGIRVLNMADSRPSSVTPISRPSPGNADARSRSQVSGSVSSTSAGASVGGVRDERGRQTQPVTPVTATGPPPGADQGAPGGISGHSGRGQTASSLGSAVQDSRLDIVDQLSMEEIRAANKALVDRIRAGLKGNEQQFADFKDVSARFRKGEMSSRDYNGHVARLGLSYVVPELARLCPDPRKRTELMEAHRGGLTLGQARPPGFGGTPPPSHTAMGKSPGETGKGKSMEEQGSLQPASLAILPSLSVWVQPSNEEVEVLSTDGYRRAKGKSKVEEGGSSISSMEKASLDDSAVAHDRSLQVLVKASRSLLESPAEAGSIVVSSVPAGGWACVVCTLVNQVGTFQCAACSSTGPAGAAANEAEKGDAAGSDKRKKKLPKFQRVRLGDGSAAALLDSTTSNPWGSDLVQNGNATPAVTQGRSFGRGAWNNGGGQRLVSLAQRESDIDAAGGRK